MTRIGIAYEPSPAGDDCGGSHHYLRRVGDALRELGDVSHLPVDADFADRLTSDDVGIVCNLARGSGSTYPRHEVARILDRAGVAFTGGTPSAHELAASRSALKAVLQVQGLPVAAYTDVQAPLDIGAFAQRRFPMTVFRARDLPPFRHRAIVRDLAELETAVERLGGREGTALTVETLAAETSFACVLIGNGRSRTLLPPVTLEWSASGAARAPSVERVPAGMIEELESLAQRVTEVVGCRDIAIVEVGLSEAGVPSVVGVDPLPLVGCTRSDDVVSLASSAAGVGMREVVQRCVLSAAERSRVPIARAPVLERLPRFSPPRGQPAFRPAQRT